MAEAAAAAALYGLETAVEGAGAAGLIIKRPTMPLIARWRKISGDISLPRSKHTMSLIKGRAYIFGGEVKNKTAADNDMHVINLPTTDEAQVDYTTYTDNPGSRPAARVGHTAAVVSDRIYMFGGRDPSTQQFLEEKGRIWVFDTVIRKWSYVDPMPETPFPRTRSRHAMAASDHPLPSVAAKEAGAAAVAPHGSLFISCGMGPEGLISDCWCFDIAAATWSKFPEPPGPARESPAMTFTGNRLYLYGGFDGTSHLGNRMDYVRLAKSTFDDKGGKSEAAVFSETDKWESVVMGQGDASPGSRSGVGLHPITTGQGRNFIIAILGETGSGIDDKRLVCNDVWTYQVQPTGKTGASFKDATREAIGAKTAEDTWAKVEIPEFSKTQGHIPHPSGRVDFATAYDDTFEKMTVVLWGGIGPDGNQLGDGWILVID